MAEAFAGKAVIVTGASSGIGRTIAVELGRQGAELWLIGRSRSELEETARQIAGAGGPAAHVAAMDLQQRGPLATLIAEVGASHPYLFGLISNAGVMYPEPIMEGTIERWQQMIDINVMAMLEGCQAAVMAMRTHGRPGHLINIGSVQARFEVPGVYGLTKRATLAIGDTLREELEQDDIRVCTIVPGGFTTNLSRGFRPETMEKLMKGFETIGMEFGAPGTEKVLSDPQHIADMVCYVMQAPIELNIQEVVMRPPISTKA